MQFVIGTKFYKMKNLLFFTALLVCCISCKKDNENLSDKIIGEWKLSTFAINSCPDTSNNLANTIADIDGCLTANGTAICQKVVFNADGTATNTSETNGQVEVQTVTYTVDNENNEVISCDSSGTCNTITFIDNRLNLTGNFGDCIFLSTYIKN